MIGMELIINEVSWNFGIQTLKFRNQKAGNEIDSERRLKNQWMYSDWAWMKDWIWRMKIEGLIEAERKKWADANNQQIKTNEQEEMTANKSNNLNSQFQSAIHQINQITLIEFDLIAGIEMELNDCLFVAVHFWKYYKIKRMKRMIGRKLWFAVVSVK